MEPTPVAAQQAAIREVRARYERGELTSEAFERALDALLMARGADECETILRALPPHPLAALAALEPPKPPAPRAAPDQAPAQTQRITAFMAQTKKMRRPWKLLPSARTLALMGEVQLDLGRAELAPHTTIQVKAIMGTVILYVPRGMRVTVRSRVYLGDVDAMGEHVSGVVAFGHEEHTPAGGPAPVEVNVEVLSVMSSVRVVLTDGQPVVSLSEVMRETIRAAATGIARGLQQGAREQQPPLPPAGETSASAGRMRIAGPPDGPRGH